MARLFGKSELRAVGGVALVAALAVCFLLASLSGCGSTTTTVTTEPPTTTTTVPGEVVKIDENADGTLIHLHPGFLLLVVLRGEPSAGYTWNMGIPERDILKVLPGPTIDAGTMPGETSRYTFSFLALSTGKTDVEARYMGPDGKVAKTFKVTIEVDPSKPTTTTTAKPTTTTTAKPTTTTTAGPTTTTAGPTTTTTAPPTTTTTAAPTTTTTQPYHPTTTTLMGVIYVDETSDGKIVYMRSSFVLNLTLRFNPATGYTWKLLPIGDDVLKLTGPPTFIPGGKDPGAPGYMVWEFQPVGEGSVELEVDLLRPDGTKVDNFYLGVVVED